MLLEQSRAKVGEEQNLVSNVLISKIPTFKTKKQKKIAYFWRINRIKSIRTSTCFLLRSIHFLLSLSLPLFFFLSFSLSLFVCMFLCLFLHQSMLILLLLNMLTRKSPVYMFIFDIIHLFN